MCYVLVLGLTYKADVDDLRESPALQIAKELCKNKNINLFVSEPNIRQQKLKSLFETQAISTQEGIEKSDIIIYLVGHKRFKAIDQKVLKNKIILDFCGITNKPRLNNSQTNIFSANNIENINTNILNKGENIFYSSNKE
jgi:UDP-N-acetyl-D-mannosaminuronate dehydrogenase